MKRFRFKLESCLKLRRHLEESEEIRLGELMREELRLKTENRELRSALAKARREMNKQTRITSEGLNLYRKYIVSLERKIRNIEEELLRLAAKINIQRSILLKARRNRRVVDRLKEKRKQRYSQESDREIQSELEELHRLHQGNG
jgi:flagellar FliJ protein